MEKISFKTLNNNPNLKVQNQPMSLPKTPIAPNRCWQIAALFINFFTQFILCLN